MRSRDFSPCYLNMKKMADIELRITAAEMRLTNKPQNKNSVKNKGEILHNSGQNWRYA